MSPVNEWSDGYVTDLEYTFGYYAELNPLRVKLAFLNAGLVCPDIGHACELGFGQGLSVNFHAAATITRWTGTDLNPTHVQFANTLANVSGSDCKLYEQRISEFVNRPDLPDFDYICLHGVWSWISNENRASIVNFLKRKLKVGGVLYVSYNTQPGFAGMAPVRDLFVDYGDAVVDKACGTGARVATTLEFIQRLMSVSPEFCAGNPLAARRVKSLTGMSQNYLAHEYFNRDWLPMSFGSIFKWLAPANLSFACPANGLDVVKRLRLSRDQASMLDELPNATLRETAYDFVFNQSFRRDYWVKGGDRLNSLDRVEGLLSVRVMLTAPATQVREMLTFLRLEKLLCVGALDPIIDALDDYRPRSLGELASVAGASGIGFSELVKFTMALTGADMMAPVLDGHMTARAKVRTDKLNAYVVGKARDSANIAYLASPVTGGGVRVNRFQQLLLLASKKGVLTPEECSRFAVREMRNITAANNLNVEDALLQHPKFKQLVEHSDSFVSTYLPILRALQIA